MTFWMKWDVLDVLKPSLTTSMCSAVGSLLQVLWSEWDLNLVRESFRPTKLGDDPRLVSDGFCCWTSKPWVWPSDLCTNKRCTKDRQRSGRISRKYSSKTSNTMPVVNLFQATARFDAICDMPRCLDSPVVTYLVWQMNVKADDNMMITWW